MQIREKLSANLSLVKEKSPLIHHITNYVTVNDCANIVLAIGGSPVMADDLEEVEEMVGFASALVINIGTLNSRTIESMLSAGLKAKELGVPVILDPVGVGATKLRTNTAARLIQALKPEVIRGNMSEIKVLAGLEVAIKGVDSLADEQDGSVVAKTLASELDSIIAITGKTDVVSDGKQVCLLDNGHQILADVTGTGCMTTSLVGTYCGVTKDYFSAAVAGITSMGLAGEIAHAALRHGEGIGTFRTRLFDSIYNLTPELLAREGKIRYE
ncbi:hydroxyethylthiazole kinase [Desulfosporosinus meridiei]|uniref:Hydroxyethylthiazole kinase n=1 Tax=Desulfosporosinus meridiei (strain ATCC BAA-275 / DSM 13257 / KCTC 12902 / NCIMB 13706 / S10) TaxID=768704 RepID=J7IPG9_DESMD|nr:hydroxyethylthiazole kinase [Desulfosporosinus meridiei]AFQ43737.1 hydroxyethylthiazole kinase [Desulfosporosinus meridiei DSM 13257]